MSDKSQGPDEELATPSLWNSLLSVLPGVVMAALLFRNGTANDPVLWGLFFWTTIAGFLLAGAAAVVRMYLEMVDESQAEKTARWAVRLLGVPLGVLLLGSTGWGPFELFISISGAVWGVVLFWMAPALGALRRRAMLVSNAVIGGPMERWVLKRQRRPK